MHKIHPLVHALVRALVHALVHALVSGWLEYALVRVAVSRVRGILVYLVLGVHVHTMCISTCRP